MISTYDIVRAFSKAIKSRIKGSKYDTDIYIDRADFDSFNNDKESAFFVEKHTISSDIATLETNNVNSIIDIFYYPKADQEATTEDMYRISDLILPALARNIAVKEDVIDIFDVDTNIAKDDVGKYLHIAVTIDYFDFIYEEKENKTLMGDFNISVEVDVKVDN